MPEPDDPRGSPTDPSAYYAVDESLRLDTDGGEGSDALAGGDDTLHLDEVRTAPDQVFATMDPDPEVGP